MENGSWRTDETYIKVKGRWINLYRAVDKPRADDRFISERGKPYVAAARRFFRKALKQSRTMTWELS